MTHYDSVDLPLGPGGEVLTRPARAPFPLFSTSLTAAGVEARETERLDTRFTLRTAVRAERPELPDIGVHFTFVAPAAINREGPDPLRYGTGARVWDHDCAPLPKGTSTTDSAPDAKRGPKPTYR